jgi:hypothetical protein
MTAGREGGQGGSEWAEGRGEARWVRASEPAPCQAGLSRAGACWGSIRPIIRQRVRRSSID